MIATPASGPTRWRRRRARFVVSIGVLALLVAGCAELSDERRVAATPSGSSSVPGQSPSPTWSPNPEDFAELGRPAPIPKASGSGRPRPVRIRPGYCSPVGVRITTGQRDAALGLRTLELRLENCGSRSFTVAGYPAVLVLDAERRAFPVTVERNPRGLDGQLQALREVRLPPGGAASLVLEWRNTVTDGDPVNGSYLEVVPRAGDLPQLVKLEHGMDLGTTGRLKSGPWR